MTSTGITCLALVLSFGVSTFAQNLTIIVNVPGLGEIEGNAANTARDIRPYWTFHGIPYAFIDSYTGTNRFQPSKLHTGPLTNDGTPFIANRIRIMCPQPALFEIPINPTKAEDQDLPSLYQASRNFRRSRIQSFRNSQSFPNEEVPKAWGQEECLVLNVNTPKLPTEENKELLPVILYIHGGGSTAFWGSIFTGLRLMEKDVVLVTINYRLGTLGALDFGIDEAPGAQAMYDAVVALKWIQQYIEYFGGDPARVTLTGQSAGSMMTTHLVLSPLAKGLFQAAWGFSGSALNVWGTTRSPSISHHLDIAHYTGCYNRTTQLPSDYKVITECLSLLPIDDLVEAYNKYEFQEVSAGRLGYDAVVPSVQSPSLTIERFLSEDPVQILKDGRHNIVPLVLGATRHDGSFVVDDIYHDYLLPEGLIHNETYMRNDMMPQLFKTFGLEDVTGGMYHSMAKSYLGEYANTVDFDSKIPGLIDISTVFGFKGGMYKILEYNAKFEPRSYFYSFDYKGRWTVYGFLGTYIPGGICHVDDMFYLFYLGPLLNDDMKVSRRMVDYLVNFAYTGNPTPTTTRVGEVIWPAYDEVDHKYLVINRVDKVEPQAPDSWIGASEELVDRPVKIMTH